MCGDGVERSPRNGLQGPWSCAGSRGACWVHPLLASAGAPRPHDVPRHDRHVAHCGSCPGPAAPLVAAAAHGPRRVQRFDGAIARRGHTQVAGSTGRSGADPIKWQCGGAGVAVGQHRRHGRCSGVHVHPAAGCAAPAPRHAGPSTTPTTICMQVAATVVQWSSTQGPVLVPSGACISRGSQGSAVPSASAGADHEAPVAVVAVVTVVASCPAPKCRRRGPRWRWCPRESRDPPSPVSITEC